MATSVLIPLDGWPQAEEALPVGMRLARAKQGGIVLVRSTTEHPTPAEQAEAEDYLRRIAGRYHDEGEAVETVVAHGDPARTIVHTASARQVALIVMATHGRSGLGRWIYGSVADSVLGHTSVPLVLVPAPTGAVSPWTTDRPFRILVPLDGSDRSASVVGPARQLARDLGAVIVLLRVVHSPPRYAVIPRGVVPVVEPDSEAQLNKGRQYLERVADRLRPTVRAVGVRCELGNPTAVIARVAAEDRADLIAMATHGHGGLPRFVLGSVAMGTVQRARLPVLLVPPVGLQSSTAPEPAGIQMVPAADGPTVSLPLTTVELDLVHRALRSLYYRDATTPELARCIDDLRKRVGQATHSR
jgi:nucleotide-binding universal stress UspA family protein